MTTVSGSATIGKFIKTTSNIYGSTVYLSVMSENFNRGKVDRVWLNLAILFKDPKKCRQLISRGLFRVGNSLTFRGVPYLIDYKFYGATAVYVDGDASLDFNQTYTPGITMSGNFEVSSSPIIHPLRNGFNFNFKSNFTTIAFGREQHVTWDFEVFIDSKDPDFNGIKERPPIIGNHLFLHGSLYPIYKKGSRTAVGTYVVKDFVGVEINAIPKKNNNIDVDSLEVIDMLYSERKENLKYA